MLNKCARGLAFAPIVNFRYFALKLLEMELRSLGVRLILRGYCCFNRSGHVAPLVRFKNATIGKT